MEQQKHYFISHPFLMAKEIVILLNSHQFRHNILFQSLSVKKTSLGVF